jgi:hypothetical protein
MFFPLPELIVPPAIELLMVGEDASFGGPVQSMNGEPEIMSPTTACLWGTIEIGPDLLPRL